MNKLKRITSIALAVLLVFASIPTINVSAAKIKLSKTKITIYVGKTVTLKVQNNKKKVKWTTSNKKIADVYKRQAWILKCIELGKENGSVHPEPEAPVKTNFIR